MSRIRPMGFADGGKINLLLYGRSGTGKTTLWGTFPGQTLAILASGSDEPGELRSIDTAEHRKRVQQVVLGQPDDDGERTPVVEELDQLIAHVESGGFDNVVLDHVTGLADMLLADIMGIDELPAQKSFGMTTRENYGQQTIQLKTVLRRLLGCRCNVVIIGQERVFNGGDEDTSQVDALKPTVGAALGPSATNWLNSTCDYIAQTFIRQKVVQKQIKKTDAKGKVTLKTVDQVTDQAEYCLRVGPSGVFHTKFRVPGGLRTDVVVDPTYTKIMSLIRGGDNSNEE